MDATAQILTDLKGKIEKTLKHVRDQLGSIRTGRASPTLVDTIRVDYYGTPTPVNQVSTVTVVDARMLSVKPWEK